MMSAPLPQVTGLTRFPTPSVARRLSCWLYEGMLLFGVIFIAGYLFSTLSQTRHALDNRHGLQAFVCLVLAVYFTWFWHKGQTLAMKTWHLRLVDTNGQVLTQRRALLRYALSWVWFMPPLVFAQLSNAPALITVLACLIWVFVWAILSRFHPDRQFWHDHWSGTRLIDVRPAPASVHSNDLNT
ncbi:MAG: hypothetical protein RLZZ566_267 [Pseudomonadota bacterium]|jgi:uncharacterized RDD family membrane protein YckC